MKKFILGCMFIGFGLASIQHFSKMEDQVDDAFTKRVNQQYEEQVVDLKIRGLVNGAKTQDDLDKAEMMLQQLPQAYRDSIMPTLSLKRSAFWFNEAEEHLRKAIEIERAVSFPQPPPKTWPPVDESDTEQLPPPAKELHPLTTANLNKAIALYEKARKNAEALKDDGTTDFNYHLNYLKGEIYYRMLELVADQESAQEIFNQALTYYKYALRSRNNDMNTVINIEILIKNGGGLVNNAGNPQAKKKQLLTSKKYGIGRSSGN